jgi:hypothetical protein
MTTDTLENWLKAFLLIGGPGIAMAFFLAWLTGRVSRYLQSDGALESWFSIQKYFLRGRAPMRRLTYPAYNRVMAFIFMALGVLMLLVWLGKLVQLLIT